MNHSLFIKTDGTLWVMGLNSYGQLGNGTTTDAHTQISVGSNVVAVTAGQNHSLFVKNDGRLWAMGITPKASGATARRAAPICQSSVPILWLRNFSADGTQRGAGQQQCNADSALGQLYMGGTISVSVSTRRPD